MTERRKTERRAMPWMKWFGADWRSDPCLSMCSPATRGIWADLISAMQQEGVGTISGTLEQLARVGRCTADEMATALAELKVSGAADVTEENCRFTLLSRRLLRECDARKMARLRQEKSRNQAKERMKNYRDRLSRENNGVEARGYKLEARDQKLEEEQKKPDRKKPAAAPQPLPFRPQQALDALAAGGRFVATKPSKGQAINLTRLIRETPDLNTWRLVGEWLAAGGESWRQSVDTRALSDFSAWVTHAMRWAESGRPDPRRNGAAQAPKTTGMRPPMAHEAETRDATDEYT